MPLLQELIGAGTPALQTQGILGSVANGLTAAGSSNTDALQLTAAINRVTTTAASTGVVLPSAMLTPGARVTVINSGANALLVYPGTGAQINALTATTGGFSVAAGGRADFIGVTNTNWFAILSA
jgi:hypothetical protein